MTPESSDAERWCVVTGGRGFAARHLVEMLVRYEMFLVRIADLAPAIQLDPQEQSGVLGEAMRSGRVQYVSADLRDKSQVVKGNLARLFLLTLFVLICDRGGSLEQLLRERRWCSTWRLRIRLSIITSFTTRLMFKVTFIRNSCNFLLLLSMFNALILQGRKM